MERQVDDLHPDAIIARLAGRQHGVVSWGQLREAGVGRGVVDFRLRTRRLHRVHRGVYAVGHPLLSREGRWLAAVLACGPGAVLSHRSAAALWDLSAAATARIDVTVPSTAGRARRAGIALHRTRRLADAETTLQDAIPVTTPARTLLDLAEVLPPRALARALEQAVVVGRFDLRALDAVLRANPGRVGAAALARAIAEGSDHPPLTRSVLERRFLDLCAEHGLPRPEVNVRVGGYEVDFLWRAPRVVVETDGHRFHASRGAMERDRARDVDLTRAGHHVLRLTHHQVTREGLHVAATVGALLRSRAR